MFCVPALSRVFMGSGLLQEGGGSFVSAIAYLTYFVASDDSSRRCNF